MRLTPQDRHAIVQATAEVAGPAARALLFGSRTDDHARGGDIDLRVELPQAPADPLGLSLKLSARIQRRVGVRRIDVPVADPAARRRRCCRTRRGRRRRS